MKYIVSKLTWDHLGNLRFDERSSEAIPIEWIEQYRQHRYDYADEYNARAVLKRLLEDWVKENEID